MSVVQSSECRSSYFGLSRPDWKANHAIQLGKHSHELILRMLNPSRARPHVHIKNPGIKERQMINRD
jgi:hypothetical protein